MTNYCQQCGWPGASPNIHPCVGHWKMATTEERQAMGNGCDCEHDQLAKDCRQDSRKSEAKRTPSPWRTMANYDKDSRTLRKLTVELQDDRPVGVYRGDYLLAVVWPGPDGPGFDGERAKGNAEFIVKACNAHEALTNENAKLREALTAIAEGKGPFSFDPLEHASNCIEAMCEIARSALGRNENE